MLLPDVLPAILNVTPDCVMVKSLLLEACPVTHKIAAVLAYGLDVVSVTFPVEDVSASVKSAPDEIAHAAEVPAGVANCEVYVIVLALRLLAIPTRLEKV